MITYMYIQHVHACTCIHNMCMYMYLLSKDTSDQQILHETGYKHIIRRSSPLYTVREKSEEMGWYGGRSKEDCTSISSQVSEQAVAEQLTTGCAEDSDFKKNWDTCFLSSLNRGNNQ